MLDMCVISDTGTHENDALDVFEDALSLNIPPQNTNSVIRCYFFTAHKEAALNWHGGIWCSYDYEECSDDKNPKCINEEHQLYTIGFEIPLDELTGENAKELLILKIMQFRDALLQTES